MGITDDLCVFLLDILWWTGHYTLLSWSPPPPPHQYLMHAESSEAVFVNLLRSPGTDSQPGGPVRQPYLLYRPVRLHRLAESIPWNLFLGSLNVYKYGLWGCGIQHTWPTDSHFTHMFLRCCYITVDSATTALQNGACTYRCMSKQMHYETTFFTQRLHEKSGILWKLHHSVQSEKKTTFWQYYIHSGPCMVYYLKWLK